MTKKNERLTKQRNTGNKEIREKDGVRKNGIDMQKRTKTR